MKVYLFYRKSFPDNYSIEKIFDGVLFSLQNELKVTKRIVPYYSNSIYGRLKNLIWVSKNQARINHVTGDIHYVAIGLRKKNTILTIHDLNFLNRSNPFSLLIYYLLWIKWPVKKAKVITVISEATKQDLLNRVAIPESKIKVIPNYYNPNYTPVPKVFIKQKPRILQIGTKKNKNVIRLISALEGLSCSLIIIGKHEREIEDQLIKRKIDYKWLSNLTDDEIKIQYENCDIVSFISTFEGFGMPILEAQAIGRVVITSNISSMPEVAGNGALFVDPYNIDCIREGISKLIEDDTLRDVLINNGLENIKRFELKRIASMYHRLYQEVYDDLENEI
ncbi:glycosyltransferase family 4 protein [Flavisolibacter ginsengisoli]|jgi:glycosyltransferase involved in cell wall biosynthesis|uniref:Glycosyltransferase involved in cell wall bisynthesis n=1 Tax=Flavisolibacter ginsengisoli DSM 18119 TaxID=1121884 RepID=A0A1M5E283_9BACT|nr:glycosyltransferase family 1 protein [Flavisolibacter ginsengisoli]SHF73244.1 Glycosyltransferase involved in cell wall bisynthesis [Flavisolibacter ginsengisoli DSM 18119]